MFYQLSKREIWSRIYKKKTQYEILFHLVCLRCLEKVCIFNHMSVGTPYTVHVHLYMYNYNSNIINFAIMIFNEVFRKNMCRARVVRHTVFTHHNMQKKCTLYMYVSFRSEFENLLNQLVK